MTEKENSTNVIRGLLDSWYDLFVKDLSDTLEEQGYVIVKADELRALQEGGEKLHGIPAEEPPALVGAETLQRLLNERDHAAPIDGALEAATSDVEPE